MLNDSSPNLDDITAYTPFLARLTAVASGSGSQASLNIYSWTEQSYDASTGIPQDANPPRSGSPTSGYAIEASNQLVTVPGSTPSGYPAAGPYVLMKLKGTVNGAPVYEFDAGQAGSSAQWISVTSLTPSTITIGSGGTVKSYPAVLTSWSSATGVWTDTATVVWFYPANGNVPVIGNRYQCISFGTASDTKAVWGEDTQDEDQWAKITSAVGTTITIGSGTVTAYACVTSTFSQSTGAWIDGATAYWFYSTNGDIPTLSNRYKCKSVAFETSSGKQVFASSQNTTNAFSGASYVLSNNTSVPTGGAGTVLSMTGSSQQYDSDSYTNALTAPATGHYRGFFIVKCPAPPGTAASYHLTVNVVGSTVDFQVFAAGNVQVEFEESLTAGTSVGCSVVQNSGSSLNFSVWKACIFLGLIPGIKINSGTITGVI